MPKEMKLKEYIFSDIESEEEDLIKGLMIKLSEYDYVREFIGEKVGMVINILEGKK